MKHQYFLLAALAFAACEGAVVRSTPQGTTPADRAPTGNATSDTPPVQPEPPEVYEPTGAIDGRTRVAFALPDNGEPPAFYDTPWPSDMFKRNDGSIDFMRFPQSNRLIVNTYMTQATRDINAFSVSQTAYFRFTAPPSLGNLPSPGDSMGITSPVMLVDVDPQSPERGALIPIETRFYPKRLTYVDANTLAVKPFPGFVLRPGTLYAYVIRRDLNDQSGELLGTAADLEAIKSTKPRNDSDEELQRGVHGPTFDLLSSLGIKRIDIAAIAQFRTMNPAQVTEKMMEKVASAPPRYQPKIVSATWGANGNKYATVSGYYCTPNFQTKVELAPYGGNEGGTIGFDSFGNPSFADIPANYRSDDDECTPMMKARFHLSFPYSESNPVAMPSAGWPLLVSAHGTGGDSKTFIGNDDFAGWAANNGIAVVSTDQPLHGDVGDPGRRPGSDKPVVLTISGLPIPLPPGVQFTAKEMFYNPVNPAAGRDNARQSTIDTVVLARLISALDFATAKTTGGADLLAGAGNKPRPRFDASKIMLAGHSQGSQTVAPQAALDPLVKGVILSGCGGDIRYGILRRTNPFDLKSLLSSVLSMDGDELDEFHPLMSVAQMFADPVDPQSYARYYREPLAGRAPQNVLHYVGINDTYNPRQTGEALAVALEAEELAPGFGTLTGLSILGVPTKTGTLRANNGPNATIGFVALEAPPPHDGHFVLYRVPGASELTEQFLRTLTSTGVAEIGPFVP